MLGSSSYIELHWKQSIPWWLCKVPSPSSAANTQERFGAPFIFSTKLLLNPQRRRCFPTSFDKDTTTSLKISSKIHYQKKQTIVHFFRRWSYPYRVDNRGAKTQNFPDSNFLRAKTFRTKCTKPFLTPSQKNAFLPLDRSKNSVFVLHKVKNGPKRSYIIPKWAKNVWNKAKNGVFGPEIPTF